MAAPSSALQPRRALMAGIAALIAVTLMIAIKSFAWWQSGAASVMASLTDSVMDASVSAMSLFAFYISLKPADAEHRYGHGKVEGLAALGQAAFIGGAAVFLLLEAGERFLRPVRPQGYETVLTVMALSTVLSLVLVAVQKAALRRAPSLAVEADRAHYQSDIVVNIGVMIVTLALRQGAPAWIDPAFALLVAAWLGRTAQSIAGKGLDMLLDRELPGDVREKIMRHVLSRRNVLGMHDLRTNKSGMRVFMSFDIEVDASLSLREAHDITRQVELSLLNDFPQADIMIHVDPYGDTTDSRHRIAGVHH